MWSITIIPWHDPRIHASLADSAQSARDEFKVRQDPCLDSKNVPLCIGFIGVGDHNQGHTDGSPNVKIEDVPGFLLKYYQWDLGMNKM